MSDTYTKEYYMPCVKCPFCKEIVEAKVIEKDSMKKISCPNCQKFAEYPVQPEE